MRSEGRRSEEKASEASRGRSVGRWSIETTVSGGPAAILQAEILLACWKKMREKDAPGNVHGRLVKGRVDRVDRDGVVGVGRVAADIDDAAEVTLVANGSDGSGIDE